MTQAVKQNTPCGALWKKLRNNEQLAMGFMFCLAAEQLDFDNASIFLTSLRSPHFVSDSLKKDTVITSRSNATA